ncbi:MAG: 2-hydroxy-3-oxopropionate reductase [Oscillospiraceae bacterium]|nr:2-hydroxy-3-oxopropionate reductase [Oscillospiraceae bacterium]
MSIGFIGLGIMGKPMAKNLLKAGYSLSVYDINADAVKEVAADGAKACSSVGDAAKDAKIIITMLPDSPQVEDVILGAGGVCENAKAGALVVDMSSIAPESAIKVATALSEKGIRMIDAPVSGGEPKAIDGTLAIMVGGKQADFDEAKQVFDVLGSSALLVGEIGSGNICKLTNQMIVAINIAALSEGLFLAKKAGADPSKVWSAIKGGLAGSNVMNAKAPMMLEGNFTPGFKVDLHIKDINNAMKTAQENETPIPLTAAVMQFMQAIKLDGHGQSDHSALAKFYEKICEETL